MKWEKVKLGDIILIKKGDYITKKEAKEGPFPVILGGREPAYYIDHYNHTGKAIVVSRSGASAGFVSKWNEPIFVTDGFLVEPKESICFEYLYYLLKSSQSKLQGLQGGSAIPHITPRTIGAIEFFLPSLEEQESIAQRLTAYDDLIENNQKQIKLLEEMAQRLYKEWFVDLRFPGYETTPIINNLPQGWEYDKIGNKFITTSGGTPSRTRKEYYIDGFYPWIKTQELQDGFIFDTEEKITEEAVKNSSAKVIPSDSIVLAMYGATIGRLGITTKEMTCNQACCVFAMEDKKEYTYYLFNWLIKNRQFLISQGKGAAQPNLSQALIKSLELCLPDHDTIVTFARIVEPIYTEIKCLQDRINNLKYSRDRLLPKLMNGEIEV